MVAIIIVTYNVPDLIIHQAKHLQHFCKDNYELIVVDNSTNQNAIDAIKWHCDNLDVRLIKTNSSTVMGSDSHAFAANIAYHLIHSENFYTHYFFLDHDCFPIKPFSVVEILQDKEIAGLGQVRKGKHYFWAGCVMFPHYTEGIDFSTNHEYGLDTGGNLYKVIDKYGMDRCTFFSEEYEQNPHFNKSFYNFYSLIHQKSFFHFLNSSNWNNAADNQERINSLLNILSTHLT